MAKSLIQEIQSGNITATPQQSAGGDLLQQLQAAGIEPAYAQTGKAKTGGDGFIADLTQPFRQLGAQASASVAGTGALIGSLARGDSREEMAQNISAAIEKPRFGETAIGATYDQNKTTAQNIVQDTGKMLGTGLEIGSYLAPGTIGAKGAVQGAKAATAGSKAIRPLMDFGKAGAASGFLGQTGRELQDQAPLPGALGRIVGASTMGTALGVGIPGAGRLASKVSSPIASAAGNVGAEILGKTTGAGAAAVKKVFDDPNVIRHVRNGSGSTTDLLSQALQDAKSGLSILKKQRGDAYRAQLDKISVSKQNLDNIINSTRDRTKELMKEFDIKFGEGKALNNLDFGTSVIEKGQTSVQKAVNDVMKWTENTPAGLDKLKKKLSSHRDEIGQGNGAGYALVSQMLESVRDGLNSNVKGYADMTKGWREASEIITEIERALSLKNEAMQDTALRKLMSTMRQDNDFRKQLLGIISKTSGEDIEGKLAGVALSPMMPRGIAGAIQPAATTVGSVSAALNPATLPTFLLYLSASSPRLAAEAVALLGRSKSGVLTPEIKAGLARLIIQASREAVISQGETEQDLQ